ncbi:MAG: hypothetical protein CM15mP120_29710 [Pseudomonadota bacterium]|nr:MAG: hypothetical protein CM15mP120_29710 [Pseudomonadota bacterium]
MQRALGLAHRAAELGEVPIGAVLVRDNEVLGEGFNQCIGNTTQPPTRKSWPYGPVGNTSAITVCPVLNSTLPWNLA